MLNMQQHPSAIAGLRSQLAAGHIANLSDFWRDAESLNVPLVTPVDGAKDERDVTFLWRAGHPLQGVYLRLNRVTDKEHVAKGMMTALPATDIWTLTLRLPASYCGSYSLVEIPRHPGRDDCTVRRPLCYPRRARRSAKQNAGDQRSGKHTGVGAGA